jgi:hypothetical protein
MKTYILDIETAPLAQNEILRFAPEFKADSRLKDPAKIAEDLKTKQEKFISNAALNPLVSKVCAVGLLDVQAPENTPTDAVIAYGDDEQALLLKVAKLVEEKPLRLITFNGIAFDLPFICRRGLLYGLNLFPYFFRPDGGAKIGDGVHVDIAAVWDCRRKDYISLRELSRFLGVGDKQSDGPLFHEMLKTDTRAAEAYLMNDLHLTKAVAKKMGLL